MEDDSMSDFLDDIKTLLHRDKPSTDAKLIRKFNKVHPEIASSSTSSQNEASAVPSRNEITIGEDTETMKTQLKETYDLLINARDTLESINFVNLKGRLRSVHPHTSEAEIDEILNSPQFDKPYDTVTEVLNVHIKSNPGELENIPELKTFIRACTDLQRGLLNVNKHSERFEVLKSEIQHEIERNKKITREMKAAVEGINMK